MTDLEHRKDVRAYRNAVASEQRAEDESYADEDSALRHQVYVLSQEVVRLSASPSAAKDALNRIGKLLEKADKEDRIFVDVAEIRDAMLHR